MSNVKADVQRFVRRDKVIAPTSGYRPFEIVMPASRRVYRSVPQLAVNLPQIAGSSHPTYNLVHRLLSRSHQPAGFAQIFRVL